MANATKHHTKKTATGTAKTITVSADITQDITLLFKDLTSPEEKVVYDVKPRPNLDDINGGIAEPLQLPEGDLLIYDVVFRQQDQFPGSARPRLVERMPGD